MDKKVVKAGEMVYLFLRDDYELGNTIISSLVKRHCNKSSWSPFSAFVFTT